MNHRIDRSFIGLLNATHVCQQLVAELKSCAGVLLCGAGVSKDAPTCLPVGPAITRLFAESIRQAARESGLRVPCDWSFISGMMPERVLGAGFSVFGYETFRFMDSFFDRAPNSNHRNLVRLHAYGGLRNIVTLNFDTCLESAWAAEGWAIPRPVTGYRAFTASPLRTALRLHKPHGSLFSDDILRPPEERYSNIRFSVQRVGTALDPDLVAWFRELLDGRVLFVTGYSGGDLDIFPALTAAALHCRVYWNVLHPEELLLPGKSALRGWLEGLDGGFELLPGPINQSLPGIVRQFGGDPYDPTQCIDVSSPHPELSLGAHAKDSAGMLLVGALLAHEGNALDQHQLIDAILERFPELSSSDGPERDGRRAIMAAHLRASRAHEAQEHRAAVTFHTMVYRGLCAARFSEPIATEVTEGQAWCKLAYVSASPIKRPHLGLGMIVAFAWTCRLFLTARLELDQDIAKAKLAGYFIGDLLHTYGLYVDVLLAAKAVSAALYQLAHDWYSFAVAPQGTWKPLDGFHGFRRCEAWLLWRTRDSRRRLDEASIEYTDWHRAFSHCEYIKSALPGNIGWHATILVRALLEAETNPVDGRCNARRLLAGALDEYRTRDYRAGIARIQLYKWLCEPPPNPGSRVRLLKARLRRLRALRSADWLDAADVLKRELSTDQADS